MPMPSLFLLLSSAAPAKFDFASLLEKPGYDEENLARMKLIIAVVALVALVYEASREAEENPISRRWKKIGGAFIAVLGIVSYFQFFQIGYKEFYHRWEFFHYYVGAKYYKQIGFEGIYTCTAVAESELPGGLADVKVRKLRDLRVNLIVDTTEWIEHPEKCKDAFKGKEERWEAFKHDVAFFKKVMYGNYWRDSQKDHGYNPPPVWGITGALFAELHPATEVYMKLLSCLDIGLFAGMFGLIAWAFGWRVMVVAIAFWGTQDASPFYWTGGAFLRQDWLFYTIASACMIRKQKFFWGGAFLTYGTLLRVFPMFFFAGWAVVAAAYWWKHRTLNKKHLTLAAGALAAGLVLIPTSVAVHGTKAWPDFIHHIGVHKDTPLTNHMGWKTIVAHSAPGRMQIAKDPRLQDPFEKWKNMRKQRVHDLRIVYYGGIALMMGAFVYACWKLKNLWIVEALGCLPAMILIELTCYYYSFFIFGAMLSKGRRPIEFALIIAALLTELCHLNYGWFDDRFTAMSVVFLALAVFMTGMYLRRPWLAFVKKSVKAVKPARRARAVRRAALDSTRSPTRPPPVSTARGSCFVRSPSPRSAALRLHEPQREPAGGADAAGGMNALDDACAFAASPASPTSFCTSCSASCCAPEPSLPR
jgi:hypothetical protein